MPVSWPIYGNHVTKLCNILNKIVPKITTLIASFLPVSGNFVLVIVTKFRENVISFYLGPRGGDFLSPSAAVSFRRSRSFLLPIVAVRYPYQISWLGLFRATTRSFSSTS
jgi:hypothetical protein